MKKMRKFFSSLGDKIKSIPLFGKKKAVKAVDNDEIKAIAEIKQEIISDATTPNLALKFKKQRLPRLFVSSKKGKFTTAMMIIIPVAIAATGATLGILSARRDKPTKEVEIITSKSPHRVYLLGKDNYVVPLTVSMEKKMTVQEEMIEVFNLLKVDTKLKTPYLRGYIPAAASLNGIYLEEGVLTLDLSEEFMSYEEKSELRMLESLVFSFLEFDGVNSVDIRVEDELLAVMPMFNTYVANHYDWSFGLNKSIVGLDDLLTKDRVTVYYDKSYDATTSYLVPVSVLAERGDSQVETVFNAMKVKQSLVTGLNAIKEYAAIDKTIKPAIVDEKVNVTVTDVALYDEVTIKREVYEMLKLTLDMSGIAQDVNLMIAGESYAVNGYYDQETVAVSSIIYNSVAI